MGRSRAATKRKEAWHQRLKEIPLGSIEPPESKEHDRALIESALASGSVTVTKCPPGRPPRRPKFDARPKC